MELGTCLKKETFVTSLTHFHSAVKVKMEDKIIIVPVKVLQEMVYYRKLLLIGAHLSLDLSPLIEKLGQAEWTPVLATARVV